MNIWFVAEKQSVHLKVQFTYHTAACLPPSLTVSDLFFICSVLTANCVSIKTKYKEGLRFGEAEWPPVKSVTSLIIFIFCWSVRKKSFHLFGIKLLKMHRFGIRTLLLFCCTAICVSGMRREYFLKIEEVTWNYAPSGMNVIQNKTLQEDE